MVPIPGRSRLLATALALLVAASSAWVLFRGVARAPFHGDESGWISSGIYYSDLLLARDFSRAKWDCTACSAWGGLNGHLGKLLIGAAYLSCEASNPCRFSGYYDFSTSFDENQRLGQVPPEHVLRRGRYTAATAGVICCLLAFAIGYTVRQPRLLLGILCAGLVLSTELFRLFANRAMTDAFYNLFLLTQLLTAIAIVNSRNERHVVRRLGVAGALTGLTASVKPSGVLLGVPLFLVVSVYRLGVGGGYKRTENGRAFMIGATAFLILSVTIIYVLNPTFWPSGLADVWRLLGFRDMLFAWDRRMAFQDSGPGIGEWSGSHFVDIHRSIFVAHSNATVTLLFFLGLLLCARRSLISMRHGIADVFVAPVAYFVCNYMLLICFLRLNWDRYYLPTEISMRVLAAIGIAELAVVTLRRSNVRKGTTPIGGATEVAR